MAKKKTSGKKHKFKHADTASVQTDAVQTDAGKGKATSVPAPRAALVQPAGGTTQRDFSYVVGDLRRIGIMAAGLVALEIILWYLFAHTGVGNSIYNLVQV